MRMIFVNLPVKNIEATRAFFAALGFSFNPDFSDDKTACMVIEENIFAMLMEEDRFRDFINNDISDAWKPIQDLGFMYGCSFQDIDGHVWEVAYMDMSAQ
jgi:predicted lactoylglutathione lyase